MGLSAPWNHGRAHSFAVIYFGERYELDSVEDAEATMQEIVEGLSYQPTFVTVQRIPKLVRILVSPGSNIRFEVTPPDVIPIEPLQSRADQIAAERVKALRSRPSAPRRTG